jgi:hypothetical protein
MSGVGMVRNGMTEADISCSFVMRICEPQKEGMENKLQFTMAGSLQMKSVSLLFEDMYEE